MVAAGQVAEALELAGSSAMVLYYRIWGDKAEKVGVTSLADAFQRLAANPTVCADLDEILAWTLDSTEVVGTALGLPFSVPLELHAQYGIREAQAAFGRATLESTGQTGVGVMHFAEQKTYVLLVTFQKDRKGILPQHHVCGLPHQQGTHALGISSQYGAVSRRWPEPDPPSGARVYGSHLCSGAEEAKHCDGAVHLPWTSG
jgi:hypothetical protein